MLSTTNNTGIGSVSGSGELDVALLVVSCDAYQDLWHPFFHCFFKHWPDCPFPIYLGSNATTYQDPRVRSILVGPDVDYTSNLIAMLNHIPQQWVFYWIEDWVLSAPVDTARLVNWIQMAQSQHAAYLRPIAIHPLAFTRDKTQEIGEIPKGARYRISMNIAVWNKPVFLRLLLPGETAWDIERKGSRRSDALDEEFFCPTIHTRNNPPVSFTHLVVKGRLRREACGFLKKEGLYSYLSQRPVEPLRSCWYSKIYFFVADTYSLLKWQWQRWLA